MATTSSLYIDVSVEYPLGGFIPAVLILMKVPVWFLIKSKLINIKASKIHG